MTELFRMLLLPLLRFLYRVKVTGIEHYHGAGNRVLIVANHTSLLDGVLLAVFLPGRPTFAINTQWANKWYLQPFIPFINLFRMDPTKPLSMKALIDFLKRDRRAIIFPEGRMTVTGSLMKIYEGPGMVAEKSGASVLPIAIDGAQFTPFTYLRGRVPVSWFPQITITILPPRRIEVPSELQGRARRKAARAILENIMNQVTFSTRNYRTTIFAALLDAAKRYGASHIIAEDIARKPLTYRQLIARSFMLSRAICQHTEQGERVGILLPNTLAIIVTFMAMQCRGRVPAMLNFTIGARGLLGACETAQLRTVYTSRRFVEATKLQETISTLLESQISVLYLEDIRDAIPLLHKFAALIASYFPRAIYRRLRGAVAPDDPALVLFTSGSEGMPKGVVLSHSNLLSNCAQVHCHIDVTPRDIVLLALPTFHSFGLTVGVLVPLLEGSKVFLYPSPLHYRLIPEISYEIGTTILFGTNTFLAGYARYAHPYDFYSMRHVVAGAEKLHEETRRTWADKFGIRILEGYGVTEASPVISVNNHIGNKPGTVGRLVVGMELYLAPVPGITGGGRLIVRGPNIMKGHLLHGNQGRLTPPSTERGEGWYDTADIVRIDDEGFITIMGRARRFAKIGGEMVSLTAVEELARKTWPNGTHAALSLSDTKKGERIVLVTDRHGATRKDLLETTRAHGIGELYIPRKIFIVDALPLLGTGKVDYTRLMEQVQTRQIGNALESLGSAGDKC
ncbi:MAG: AMP-binding protein [Gammaproteobacteria bacterium]|nr:AMP-binding protein [Gammaproteobacteria bacterium]MCI0591387.1 AMP-binding protein [Gammaproteobacteria bacterium]